MASFKKNTGIWILVLCTALCGGNVVQNVKNAMSRSPDIIIRDVEENQQVGLKGGPATTSEISKASGNECQIEIQETKKVTGYCIKHGMATHSCVADGYLHPFHHECLKLVQ